MASTSSRYAVVQPTIGLPSSRRRRRVAIFIVGTALTGVAALVLGMWLGGNLTQSKINGLAIGGTGTFTAWGLPASKLVMDLSSIGVIGLLLVCLLLPARGLERDSQNDQNAQHATMQRCLRTASWLALAWGISTAVLLIFSWSDVVARPVSDLPFSRLFTDTA